METKHTRDLLDACKGLVQQLTDLHAAIADLGMENLFIDDGTNMLSEGRTAIGTAEAAIAKAEPGA